MSKAAKLWFIILFIFLIVSLGIAGYSIFQQMEMRKVNISIEQELTESVSFGKSQTQKIKEVQKTLSLSQEETSQWQDDFNNEKNHSDQLAVSIEKFKADLSLSKSKNKELNNAIKKTVKERDTIRTELSKHKKLYFSASTGSNEGDGENGQVGVQQGDSPEKSRLSKDQYWANIVREKADLEVRMQLLTDRLSRGAIDLVDLRKKNENLVIELNRYKSFGDDIEEDLRYKESMINNLSLELARTKNDKKYITNRLKKVNKENTGLRSELKRFITKKAFLEKSIVKLAKDKDTISRKLVKADVLIQHRIDEMWDAKNELNKDTNNHKILEGVQSTVELDPIVIGKNGKTLPKIKTSQNKSLSGKVVSFNQDNNFVIVNFGENKKARIGDELSIYRGSKYIARIEIIQVRRDISAADVKEQWGDIRSGDIVR